MAVFLQNWSERRFWLFIYSAGHLDSAYRTCPADSVARNCKKTRVSNLLTGDGLPLYGMEGYICHPLITFLMESLNQ